MRQATKTVDQVEASLTKAGEVDKRTEKKEFEVVPELDGGLYLIKYNAGGEVPKDLQGRYTGASKAQAAIDNFVTTRRQAKGS